MQRIIANTPTSHILIACLILSLFMLSRVTRASSVTCSRDDVTTIDRLICSVPKLTELDKELKLKYENALHTYKPSAAIELRQNQWLVRRDECENNMESKYIVQCLKSQYEQRISEIEAVVGADLPCSKLPLIKNEAEKSACYQQWLTSHPAKLYTTKHSSTKIEYCEDIYKKISTGSSDVKYINPVVRTVGAYDSSLKLYRDCWEYQPSGYGVAYYGIDANAHDFRLYKIHPGGDEVSSEKEYLYEEESFGSMKNGQTQYVRVGFGSEACKVMDRVGVRAEMPRRVIPPSWGWGLNAIIFYRGEYHVIDLNGDSRFRVISYDSEHERFDSYRCDWKLSPKEQLKAGGQSDH